MQLILFIFAIVILAAAVIALPWWLSATLFAFALFFLTGPILRLLNASVVKVELACGAVVLRGGREMGPEEETFPSKLQKTLSFTNWFGRREGGLLYGGRHLKWWFETAKQFSLQNDTTGEITVRFNTKGLGSKKGDGSDAGTELTCKFPVQNRIDPRLYVDGKYLFLHIKEEKANQIIQEQLQSGVGGVGAKYEPTEFVGNRQAIVDIINCKMRLGTSPHLLHVHEDRDPSPDKRLSKKYCGLGQECEFKSAGQSCKFVEKDGEHKPDRYAFIPAEDLIGWFNLHQQTVKAILDGEAQDADDHSQIELITGRDIFKIPVTDVKFPPEIEKAFAQRLQLQKNREAFDVILEMDDKLRKRGYPPQLRADLIQVHTGQAEPRRVYSVEGDGGGQLHILEGAQGLFGGVRKKQEGNDDSPAPAKTGKKKGRR